MNFKYCDLGQPSKRVKGGPLTKFTLTIYISKNNTWRQVHPERLAHLAHRTSIANQDATSI